MAYGKTYVLRAKISENYLYAQLVSVQTQAIDDSPLQTYESRINIVHITYE